MWYCESRGNFLGRRFVSEAFFCRRNIRISQLVRHRRGNCEHLIEACVSANRRGWRERACLDVRRSNGELKAKSVTFSHVTVEVTHVLKRTGNMKNIKRVTTAGSRMCGRIHVGSTVAGRLHAGLSAGWSCYIAPHTTHDSGVTMPRNVRGSFSHQDTEEVGHGDI